MKKILLITLILGVLISCQEKNIKTNFIGNWSSTSNTFFKYDYEFYLDSMVVHNQLLSTTYSDKWKVKGDEIELELIRSDRGIINQEDTINFLFNFGKDTLSIKNKNDSVYLLKLKKINNGYEYFENSIGLEIDLKESNDSLTSLSQNKFRLNIYAAFKNNKLVCKTDHSKNLDNLGLDTFRFLEELTAEEANKMVYVLYIDRNVNQKQIDSIKNLIPKDVTSRFFRVHKYKEKKWNEPIEWFGKFEQ